MRHKIRKVKLLPGVDPKHVEMVLSAKGWIAFYDKGFWTNAPNKDLLGYIK